jgi:hypothetical protein
MIPATGVHAASTPVSQKHGMAMAEAVPLDFVPAGSTALAQHDHQCNQ